MFLPCMLSMRTGLAIVVVACLAGAAGAHAAVDRSGPPALAAGSPPASSASVAFAAGGRRIPAGFFGLAMEYNELPVYEKAGVLFRRVASIIRPRDGGPMTLRVGGKSADHTLWQPDPLTAAEKAKQKNLPRGVRAIGRTWLANLGQFVRRQDLRVLIDLNLAVHSTTMETDFATAVQHVVPRGRLAGFEIGNEPDEYHFQPPLQRERVATTGRATPLGWWRNYSPTDYRRDYASYARALKGRIGGIPLGAPDIVSDEPTWLSAVSGLGRLNPGFLAIHRYAGSTCWSKSSPLYPTISRMLSEQVTAGLAASVTQAVQFAHSHGMALRLTEVNTVSCGNDAGVAGSFATALWTPDALFEMIKVGVDGVSWEVRPKNGNAPFEFSRRRNRDASRAVRPRRVRRHDAGPLDAAQPDGERVAGGARQGMGGQELQHGEGAAGQQGRTRGQRRASRPSGPGNRPASGGAERSLQVRRDLRWDDDRP